MTAEGLVVAAVASMGDRRIELDLQVAPGETVALVGPNGAGKSTALRMLCGLVPLEAGSVTLDGRVLDDVAAGIRLTPEERSIGVVFQDLLLFPTMDVLGNVAFGLRAGGASRTAAEGAARSWLGRVGLAELERARPGRLSGGEAQRVALARALAPQPRLLLLDEPLAALDVDVRADVRRTLREHLALHTGPRVLVTHDPLDAAVLADRLVVLEAGRVTATGALDELVARPRSTWGAELAGTNLLRATAVGHRLELSTGGAITVADAPGDGAALAAVRPAAVTLHRRHPEGSARNVWSLTVAAVEGYGERVRVRLEGEVHVVAEVTAAAVAELDVRPGERLWATVKATDVAAYPA